MARRFALATAIAFLMLSPLSASDAAFLRGDANRDGKVDIADPIWFLHCSLILIECEFGPTCLDAMDADDNGRLEITDAIYTLMFLFLGGQRPPHPFTRCGIDPTEDFLTCQAHSPCAVCEERTLAIGQEAAASEIGSCNAVVRLSYEGKEILGWQLFCGSYGEGPGCSCPEGCSDEPVAGPPDLEGVMIDAWATADIARTSVIGGMNRLTLFCSVTVQDADGKGEILYPEAWRPAEELGGPCPPFDLQVPIRGFNFDGSPLEGPDVMAAVEAVRRTAIPPGLVHAQYLVDAVVLLYPRTAPWGAAPVLEDAEWIVVLTSRWLE